MDNLSKLAFMTSELLLDGINFSDRFERGRIGVIVMTANSSLDTDCHYVESVLDAEQYFPAPSVFVYTLPNIMVGEICIRNSFQGENTVLIGNSPDWKYLSAVAEYLFASGKIDACVCGWCDLFREEYRSDFFAVTKGDAESSEENFTPENILKITI